MNDLCAGGIASVVVPIIQGSRIFFSDAEGDPAAFDLAALQSACHRSGISFIPQIPFFLDADTYDRVPQYRPLNLRGEATLLDEWYKPICPANEKYRQYRLDLALRGLLHLDAQIASLSFLHYPYIPGPSGIEQDATSLTAFCYCDFCKNYFMNFSGRRNPLEDIEGWYASRCENITIVPVLLEEAMEKKGKSCRFIVEIPPVSGVDVTEALRRLTGQDLFQWRGLIHILSAQLPIFQAGLDVSWAEEVLQQLRRFSEFKVIPEIDLPIFGDESGNVAEFRELLQMMHGGGFEVVSIFHWGQLRRRPELIRVLGEFSRYGPRGK